MSVTVQSCQSIFLGNGSTTSWTFPWVGVSASDINVFLVGSTGQQTFVNPSLYSITLNSPSPGQLWGIGGAITYPLSGPPIANGTSLLVQRAVPYSQPTNVANQTAYPVSVQTALDNLCFEIQQVVGRTGQQRGIWVSGLQYNFGDIVQDGANGANTGNLYMCAIANVSGTWATDLVAGDWSLALNVQALVNTLPSIANNSVFGNISGSVAAPIGVSASALLDSAFGNAQGDILYRDTSGWKVLAPGSSGQVLATQGVAANPHWTSAGSGGTITGVTAGTGLTGGGTSGTVTVAFANITNNTLLANLSGGNAAPIGTTLSAVIDTIISNTQGAILYRNNSVWTALAPGTSGQFLKTGGGAANPSWSAVQTATSSVLGISKPDGTTLTISAGALSAATATSSALGIVQPDNTSITISAGVISAAAGLMTPLAVGSIILAKNNFTALVPAGSTLAAANMVPYTWNSSGGFTTNADTITGTWKALQSATNNSPGDVVLWQRTA